MLILVDVGNTSIKFGFAKKITPAQKAQQSLNFSDFSIVAHYTLPSKPEMYSADSLGLQLTLMLQHLKLNAEDTDALCISSVVPPLDTLLIEMADKFFKKTLFFVGRNLEVPLKNCYDNPKEVGADRLVASYAAAQLYPSEKSILSIDFGTATTFDCIENNSYLGGLICPGLFSSHAALSAQTAKLPKIALEADADSPQIGKNTVKSISHGFIFGFSAMTEGLIQKLSEQFENIPFVVATGGFSREIARYVPTIGATEPNLILKGLLFLYVNYTNNKSINQENKV